MLEHVNYLLKIKVKDIMKKYHFIKVEGNKKFKNNYGDLFNTFLTLIK